MSWVVVRNLCAFMSSFDFSVNCVCRFLIGPGIRRGWSKLADGKQVPSRFRLPCLWQVSSLYCCWQNGQPADWHAMTGHAHLINFVTVALSQSAPSPAVCYWPLVSTNEMIFSSPVKLPLLAISWFRITLFSNLFFIINFLCIFA